MSDKINDEQRRNDAQQPPPTAPQNTPASIDHDRSTNSKIADLEKRVSSYERGMLLWTRVVAAFTGVSAVIAGLYAAYSFIESERAFLTVPDVAFANSEPSSGPNGLAVIVTIKNVGKHTATGINIKVNSALFGVNKDLPPVPIDENSLVKPIFIPPIAPDGTWQGIIFEVGDIKNKSDKPMKSRAELINDVIDGNIPFRAWGVIEYDLGFPSWTTGTTGFCYEFVPIKSRVIGQRFRVCDNLPKYTYAK